MLPISLAEENKCLSIPGSSRSFLLDRIGWLNGTAPWFPYPGRVAWAILPKPIICKVTGRQFSSVKLKGVGVWSPSGWDSYSGLETGSRFEDPAPPTSEVYAYIHTTPHAGFDAKGQLVTKYADLVSYGGLTLDRALQEYCNSLELYNAGVSVTLPILVTKYEGRKFNGCPLGSVSSLLPSPYPYRLDTIIYDPASSEPLEQSFLASMRSRVRTAVGAKTSSVYDLVATIYGLYGKELRLFSIAGYYRHSGGINNCYFDMETCKVALTDFDSSKRLADIDDRVRALEVLRDCASVLYKIIFRQLHPRALAKFDIASVRNSDPIQAFLINFFSIPRDDTVRSIGDLLWEYSLRSLSVGRAHSEKIGFATQSSASEAGFNKLVFFTYSILLTSTLYRRSSLCETYRLVWTFDELLLNATRYIGEEAVQWLVNEMKSHFAIDYGV